MPLIVLYAVNSALYVALAWHFWRTRWSAAARQGPETVSLAPWERVLVLTALALHAALLAGELAVEPHLRIGFAVALSATVWLAVVIYYFESLFVNLEGLLALLLPLAAIAVPLPAIFPGLELPAYARRTEFRLHLLLAWLSYSLFTIAALHAALMAVLERRLHAGTVRGPFAAMPPLLTLETLLFRIIVVAFVLLTLTLVTGVAFHEELFGKVFRIDHKTLFGIVSWIIFAVLLAGRHFWGWRGRRALRWTMAGFVALLLAYVGSRFVLEVILDRGLT
jgi:ABC-type uncharacterized transport system permease subunit